MMADAHERVLTPEGVALHFQTASISERLVAIVIDLFLLFVVLIGLGIPLAWIGGSAPLMLLWFFGRHFWFVWFETRWQGTTPGKRRLHLRVISADGGPLTTEIVFARNLTREVELFLPLVLIVNPDLLFAGQQGVTRLLASAWILLLLLFPLTNRHRLRIGDLLAGTRVVVAPPVALLRDLADERRPVGDLVAPAPEFTFTAIQMTIYGRHELEVLEDVLRKVRSPGGASTATAVARSIARRIGWVGPVPDGARTVPFLTAFYAAQRAHLEQQMLLGKPKERQAGRK